MSGPDREARVARGHGPRIADFARGRGSRGAGRRPPATLPTLTGTVQATATSRRASEPGPRRALASGAALPSSRTEGGAFPLFRAEGAAGGGAPGAAGSLLWDELLVPPEPQLHGLRRRCPGARRRS